MQNTIQSILAAEAAAIQNIPLDNPFEPAVQCFLEAARAGGKVVVSGVGKAGGVGAKIATTLCSVGVPSIFLHPLEAQHGDLGVLGVHDCLLLISNSGKTREVVELVHLARKLHQEVRIITITGKRGSELAACSDLVLWTGGPPEVCPLGLAPTTSTTVMSVIGDVLTVLAVQIGGFTHNDYALRHHGGYLGTVAKLG
ncbi:MAG: SIS domain-containing protein [Betaproteobacteria bacterium]|nr:SIS domain-containing protein [Betaproteobacteria bacterium]